MTFKPELIGMRGTIAATNTPLEGYHSVNWDTGIQTDSKQDCLEVLTTK